MINLLPLSEKRKVRSEYLWRLGAVMGVLLAILIISALVPVVVSYFMIDYNVGYIDKIVDDIKKESISMEADVYSKEIRLLNRKIKILNEPLRASQRDNLALAFWDIFERAKDSGNIGTEYSPVKITSILYEQGQKKPLAGTADIAVSNSTSTPSAVKESGMHKIFIRGFAGKRENFQLFLKSLEENKNFISIDSPVSNLVESENVRFSIVITLKDKAI